MAGCNCRGKGRAGGTNESGQIIQGFEYTYPDGRTRRFLTAIEAKAEMRAQQGGEYKAIVS